MIIHARRALLADSLAADVTIEIADGRIASVHVGAPASEAVAAGKREGRDVAAQLARLKELSGEVKALGEQARAAEAELQDVLTSLPNLPDPTAAEPQDEVLRVVGPAGREGRDHLELA